MRDIALLILGWLFGLLGGPIAEAITRRRTALELAHAIKAELDDVSDRSAMLVITSNYDMARCSVLTTNGALRHFHAQRIQSRNAPSRTSDKSSPLVQTLNLRLLRPPIAPQGQRFRCEKSCFLFWRHSFISCTYSNQLHSRLSCGS